MAQNVVFNYVQPRQYSYFKIVLVSAIQTPSGYGATEKAAGQEFRREARAAAVGGLLTEGDDGGLLCDEPNTSTTVVASAHLLVQFCSSYTNYCNGYSCFDCYNYSSGTPSLPVPGVVIMM